MRRLFLAAALALAFHSLLFTLRFEEPQAKPVPPPRPLTLSLTHTSAEPPAPMAVSKPIEPPNPPLPPQPQPAEEKIQRPETKKPVKPFKRSASSVPPQQQEASHSPDVREFFAEINSAQIPSRESPTPTQASLGGGDNGLPPIRVREATPLYRQNPVPDYPLIARKRGLQGTVLLEVLVDRQGGVADLQLSSSSGYPVLDQAALASVKTWLFEPATRGEERVEMWVKVPVRFQLK